MESTKAIEGGDVTHYTGSVKALAVHVQWPLPRPNSFLGCHVAEAAITLVPPQAPSGGTSLHSLSAGNVYYLVTCTAANGSVALERDGPPLSDVFLHSRQASRQRVQGPTRAPHWSLYRSSSFPACCISSSAGGSFGTLKPILLNN